VLKTTLEQNHHNLLRKRGEIDLTINLRLNLEYISYINPIGSNWSGGTTWAHSQWLVSFYCSAIIKSGMKLWTKNFYSAKFSFRGSICLPNLWVLHGVVKWNTISGVSLGFQRVRMKQNAFNGVSLDFQCARNSVN